MNEQTANNFYNTLNLNTSVKVDIGIGVVAFLELSLKFRLQLVNGERLSGGEGSNGQRHGTPKTGGADDQLSNDVTPLASRDAVHGLQSIDDERRKQQD